MIDNVVLTDTHRHTFKDSITRMQSYCPEMFARKIPDSMVQFAFCYQAVLELDRSDIRNLTDRDSISILSAGSHEDIATECLKMDGFSVVGVDPVLNCDLHTFASRKQRQFNYVVSASVLEHTTDDEEFVADCCDLLLPGGYGIFTMDYKNDWSPGQRVPNTSNRFYTEFDLTQRLPKILATYGCNIYGKQDYTARDRFNWEGIDYSFATFVFKKRNKR